MAINARYVIYFLFSIILVLLIISYMSRQYRFDLFNMKNSEPPMRGWIDQVGGSMIKGWLCVKGLEHSQIFLQLYVGNKVIGTIRCNQPRPDIINQHYPECTHQYIGFSSPISTKTKDIKLFVYLLTDPPRRVPFPDTPALPKRTHARENLPLLIHRQPLPISISAFEPVRLNILMAGMGKDLTGGPLSLLHFACLAAQSGLNVRWVNIDGAGIKYSTLKEHLKNYEGLSQFGNQVEFIFDAYKSKSIPTNPNDTFVATIYFTAFMAHNTARLLSNPNIIYFIQDYEPIFFPHNSDWLEAVDSYKVPHFPIFSTPFLDSYFRKHRIGIYSNCPPKKWHDNLVHSSQPAIKKHMIFDKNNYPANRIKTLIAYARPHAPRNAYELTLATISEGVRLGVFGDVKNWRFYGVGAAFSTKNVCGLGGIPTACLIMVTNKGEASYFKLLSQGDIGLSLMVSPHPSLPPFDFAAAGMITITNSYDTKTSASFSEISRNIIVAEPYIDSLVEALRNAVGRVEDLDSREKGSKLFWANSWEDNRCYGPEMFSKIKAWMDVRQPIDKIGCDGLFPNDEDKQHSLINEVNTLYS